MAPPRPILYAGIATSESATTTEPNREYPNAKIHFFLHFRYICIKNSNFAIQLETKNMTYEIQTDLFRN